MNVYLDNNATTPVRKEVLEGMIPYLREEYGNPSSAYGLGERASSAVYRARERVAELIHALPQEVMFVGSGTESDNMAIHGALALSPGKTHIIVSSVEHPAVLKTVRILAGKGYRLTELPVDSKGNLDPDELRKSIGRDTALVSVMLANNETGVISPVEELGSIAKENNVLFHVDAVQTPGKIPLDVRKFKADFLSLSGHKFHAPKGIGVLYVRQGIDLPPLITGGGQERGRRGGTENVPYIAGIGIAADLAREDLAAKVPAIREFRDRFESQVTGQIKGSRVNGDRERRIPNTTNISFENVDESLFILLNKAGISVSPGSACNTGRREPSQVLLAMGISPERAASTVRFSLSRFTMEDEIDYAAMMLAEIVSGSGIGHKNFR